MPCEQAPFAQGLSHRAVPRWRPDLYSVVAIRCRVYEIKTRVGRPVRMFEHRLHSMHRGKRSGILTSDIVIDSILYVPSSLAEAHIRRGHPILSARGIKSLFLRCTVLTRMPEISHSRCRSVRMRRHHVRLQLF